MRQSGRKRVGEAALPEYAKSAIVEIHKTKVGRREPHIENVNDELLTSGCPHTVDCRVKGQHKVGEGGLTFVTSGVETYVRSLHRYFSRPDPEFCASLWSSGLSAHKNELMP
jgi:hypothetical protein